MGVVIDNLFLFDCAPAHWVCGDRLRKGFGSVWVGYVDQIHVGQCMSRLADTMFDWVAFLCWIGLLAYMMLRLGTLVLDLSMWGWSSPAHHRHRRFPFAQTGGGETVGKACPPPSVVKTA